MIDWGDDELAGGKAAPGRGWPWVLAGVLAGTAALAAGVLLGYVLGRAG